MNNLNKISFEEEIPKLANNIKGIISLGGMSESGKSTSGIYLSKLGVIRLKIISIEKQMMIDRKIIKPGDSPNNEHFELLYKNVDETMKEFIYRVLKFMNDNNIKYLSLESMYRKEMVEYLELYLSDKSLCIFFKTSFQIRVKREALKKNETNNLEKVIQQTLKKDEFKKNCKANEVENVATVIFNNDGKIEKLYSFLEAMYWYMENNNAN